jgi:hypothetical protein
MVELPHQSDLSQEPVGRDAYQQFRVQDFERDRLPRWIGGIEDARRAAAADLSIDRVGTLKGLTDERKDIARDRGLYRAGVGLRWGQPVSAASGGRYGW